MVRKKAADLPAKSEKPHTRFTDQRQRDFLLEYSRSGRVMHSALVAGVCDQTIHNEVKRNEEFALLYDAAKEVFKELLEKEVYRRGIDGWEEPVVQKGQVVFYPCTTCKGKYFYVDKVRTPAACEACDSTGRGDMVMTHRSSDRMLELMLKRHVPEYRDKFEMDITSTGGVLAIPIGNSDSEGDWSKKWGDEVQEAEYERVIPAVDAAISPPIDADEHPPGPCADQECDVCRERPGDKKKVRTVRVER